MTTTAKLTGKVIEECQVIEDEDGRWVLCVQGRPRLVLPATLAPALRDRP
jgi:hypothetical protein